MPVRGVLVKVSATDGSLNPSSGRTDDQGNLTTTYTAPEVTTTKKYTISATAFRDEGYPGGVGSAQITVNPPKMDYPIALLPVRIETRFVPKASDGTDLLIRVYTDDVYNDTHEPELTESEMKWGQHFWKRSWHASTNEARQKQAWAQLAERFGSQRAAWIALQLEPENQSDRPSAPVPDDQPLNPEPVFPQVANRDHSWTRAPHTRVLPDHWVAIGYKDGKHIFEERGNPIPAILPTGPSPTARITNTRDDEPIIDAGMLWMIDFEEAVKLGMGFRIPLTMEQANAGLDLLVVLGVKTSLDSNKSAQLLESLLDSHHYIDSLSLVLKGTPTNNTQETKSGFSSRDPGYDASYKTERESDLCSSNDGSDGDILAKALGIKTKVFAHVANADGVEQHDAYHMNTALWPIPGYFLSQMMAETFEDSDIRQVRRHFIEYVRARGPLPTLRIGKQPYGILPVTSLDLWTSEEDSSLDQKIVGFLRSLRDVWRRSLPLVPRVGRTGNPDADLVEILGMDATSNSYAAREVLGDHYLNNLWWFLGVNLGGYWWAQQEAMALEVLRRFGLEWNPRLARAVFSPYAFPLFGSRVQRGFLSEEKPLDPNYIKWLRESSYETIRDEKYPVGKPPNSLLYLLLRHATLLEYAVTSFHVQYRKGLITAEEYREPELINIQTDEQTSTVWNQLENVVPDVTGDLPIGRYLDGVGKKASTDTRFTFGTRDTGYGYTDIDIAEFIEFRSSLGHLEKRPTTVLKRLLNETLDLCTYRLDAWITSYATKRLKSLREQNAIGIKIGGYCWVEDLRPSLSRQLHEVEPPEDEAGSPLSVSDSNKGFIHAPSLAHATTAAVLRSGYLSHVGDKKSDLLAIDLSSDRVRLAMRLLYGVRQGQPLAALLGYRFERGLHENHPGVELDEFIMPFRVRWPFKANKLTKTKEAAESIAANNVVDGMKLLESWKEGEVSFWDQDIIKDLDINNKQRKAIEAELQALDYAVDAVSDVIAAESVYQVVQGNHLRSGATVDAVSSGEVPPPELEVVKSARSGIGITHRILALFNGDPPPQTDWPFTWPTDTRQARSEAEPHLNAWAARLLGDPSKVRCKVEYIDPKTGKVIPNVNPKILYLSDLKLSPLDVIYATVTSDRAQRSELEQRLAYYAIQNRPSGVPPDAVIKLSFQRESDWTKEEITFPQFLEITRATREVITSTRAIDARDLSLPGVDSATKIKVTELGKRADKAVGDFRKAYTTLKNFVDSPSTSSLSVVRDALLRMAHFGMQGAIPLSTVDGSNADDRKTLLNQSKSIVADAKRRDDNIMAVENILNSITDPPPDAKKVEMHLQRLHEVFGQGFVVLPQFDLPSTSKVADAFGDSKSIQDGNELAVVTWFQRAARVRSGAARLNSALVYSEALHGGNSTDFVVGQLPYQQNDRWVGLKLRKGEPLLGGRLSLVAHVPWFDPRKSVIDPQKYVVGLLIDEWVEVVLNKSETTAVSFHCDAPGACAPNAILLAVPPDPHKTWDLETLETIILETFELAKLRGVDPDSLDMLGQYLPALYFADNVERDTVATDFMRAAPPDPPPLDLSSQVDGKGG